PGSALAAAAPAPARAGDGPRFHPPRMGERDTAPDSHVAGGGEAALRDSRAAGAKRRVRRSSSRPERDGRRDLRAARAGSLREVPDDAPQLGLFRGTGRVGGAAMSARRTLLAVFAAVAAFHSAARADMPGCDLASGGDSFTN